jgi:hypothetical protein
MYSVQGEEGNSIRLTLVDSPHFAFALGAGRPAGRACATLLLLGVRWVRTHENENCCHRSDCGRHQMRDLSATLNLSCNPQF